MMMLDNNYVAAAMEMVCEDEHIKKLARLALGI